MSVVGEAVLRLRADVAEFAGQMRLAASSVETAGRHMRAAGQMLSVAVTAPLVGVATAAAHAGMRFERTMSQIEGLVGVSRSQVRAWATELKALSVEVGRSPQELAEALYFVASAGVDLADALEITRQAARAATAGLGDTQSIADAVTSAINAYGAANLSAARALDIMVAAVREGKAEASALTPVLGNLLPIASSLGIGFDQVAATLAVFSRTGMGVNEGATALQNIMVMLANTSKQAEQALAEAGLSLAQLRDVAARPGGLLEVMRMLDRAAQGNVDRLTEMVPNVRSLRGVMNVLAQDADSVRGVFDAVRDSAGALDKAFAAAADTAGFRLDQAMAAARSSLITLSEIVLPPLATVLVYVTRAVSGVSDALESLSPRAREVVLVVGAMAAALGPVLVIVGQAAIGFSALTAALAGVKSVMAAAMAGLGALGLPLVLTVAALAAVAAATVAVVRHWSVLKYEAGALAARLREELGAAAEKVAALVGGGFSAARDRALAAWKALAEGVGAGVEWIERVLARLWENSLGRVVEGFRRMYDAVVGRSYVPDMVQRIDDEFRRLDRTMVAPADEAVGRVLEAFRRLGDPVALARLGFDVSVDADQLYRAVIAAGDSAAGALRQVGAAAGPAGVAVAALWREAEQGVVRQRDYAAVVDAARAAVAEHHLALVSNRDAMLAFGTGLEETSRRVGIGWGALMEYQRAAAVSREAAERALLTQRVEVSERSRAALEAYAESLRRAEAVNRALIAVHEFMADVGRQASMALDSVRRQAVSTVATFTPMGLAALALSEALDTLKPVIDALKEPVRVVGQLLAAVLTPILKALFPLIRWLAVVATYVIEAFMVLAGVTSQITGWLLKAIGGFVEGLGKILSKIPLVGKIFEPLEKAGKAIRETGEAQIEGGKELLRAIPEVRRARRELEAMEWEEDGGGGGKDRAAGGREPGDAGDASAVRGVQESVESAGNRLVELAKEILDAVLFIRDYARQGLDYLRALAAGPGVQRTAGELVEELEGGGAGSAGWAAAGEPAGWQAGDGGYATEVTVEPGAVVIQIAGDVDPRDAEAAGRAAARGLLDELSGDAYVRAATYGVVRSGRLDPAFL